ncbi:PEBP-like protein [Mycena floridula]|nr:PEBP-like protein [Mycena floridula]
MKISTLSNFILASISLVYSQDTSLKEVKQAFIAADIPTDLTITFNPSVLLEVTFPQVTGPAITLKAGVQLPRNATAGPPTFSIVGKAGTGPFVVAAVDPDAPTPQAPTSAQIRHFLGGDFTAARRDSDKVHLLTNESVAVSEFRQPGPPAGSDAHRYIFLLFNQPAGFDSQVPTVVNSTTPVSLFNISSFAATTDLGNPIGGTFMLVAPDAA